MSVQKFFDGVLREEWNDATRLYTSWNQSHVQTSQRPYTAQENAVADAAASAAQQASQRDAILLELYNGIAGLVAAKDGATNDIAVATALRTSAQAVKDAASAQKAGVIAFNPSATYSQADITAIRDSIRDVLARQESIVQALVDFYTYRIAVDQNAVTTDDATIYLARLAAGRLSG